MEKFHVFEDSTNYLEFRIIIDKFLDLELSISILKNDDVWGWKFYTRINKWHSVYLNDENFGADFSWNFPKEFSDQIEQIRKEVNNGFYELFRQIKEDPSYRLKIINMLDDETRQLWKVI